MNARVGFRTLGTRGRGRGTRKAERGTRNVVKAGFSEIWNEMRQEWREGISEILEGRGRWFSDRWEEMQGFEALNRGFGRFCGVSFRTDETRGRGRGTRKAERGTLWRRGFRRYGTKGGREFRKFRKVRLRSLRRAQGEGISEIMERMSATSPRSAGRPRRRADQEPCGPSFARQRPVCSRRIDGLKDGNLTGIPKCSVSGAAWRRHQPQSIRQRALFQSRPSTFWYFYFRKRKGRGSGFSGRAGCSKGR